MIETEFYELRQSESYWRKRSILNENYLNELVEIIGVHLPSTQNEITMLDNAWNKAMEKLEDEYEYK